MSNEDLEKATVNGLQIMHEMGFIIVTEDGKEVFDGDVE